MARTGWAFVELDALNETEGEAKYNELITLLDIFIMPVVISRTTTTPPGSPSEGDCYLLPSSGCTGDWAGEDGNIACYYEATWIFVTPVQGTVLYSEADTGFYNNGASSSSWVSGPA